MQQRVFLGNSLKILHSQRKMQFQDNEYRCSYRSKRKRKRKREREREAKDGRIQGDDGANVF